MVHQDENTRLRARWEEEKELLKVVLKHVQFVIVAFQAELLTRQKQQQVFTPSNMQTKMIGQLGALVSNRGTSSGFLKMQQDICFSIYHAFRILTPGS